MQMQYSSDDHGGYSGRSSKSSIFPCKQTMRNNDLSHEQQQYVMEKQQQQNPYPFAPTPQPQQHCSQHRSQDSLEQAPSPHFSMHSDTLQELIKLQRQQEKIEEFIVQLRRYPVVSNVEAGYLIYNTDGSQDLNRTPMKSPDSTLLTKAQSNDKEGIDLGVFLPSSPDGPFKQAPQFQLMDRKFTTARSQINVNGSRNGASDFLSKFQKVMEESEISPGELSLPSNYHPDEFDVACGRGKGNYSRPGNRRFRDIVNRFVDEYQATQNKDKKSSLLNKIVTVVTSQNDGMCRFVRQDSKTGAWFEIGIDLARGKVGHAMREAINIRDKKMKKMKAAANAGNKKNLSDHFVTSTHGIKD